MSKRNQTSQKVLWQPISGKQSEVVRGGFGFSSGTSPSGNSWCAQTKNIIFLR